ncbi:hypothetical protein GDO81_015076 [Engystomops pustulosus]|uniref:Uncharacterized protein n=1 Tax=Engystomops pustulosus TaxID=76066 RepID=A0AAV7AMK3_ENGPU|nr:hypothetical protein GDO81_015076 [Engystomops pustulosus]
MALSHLRCQSEAEHVKVLNEGWWQERRRKMMMMMRVMKIQLEQQIFQPLLPLSAISSVTPPDSSL